MAKRITKTYDQEFKSQAVKLAQEIGGHKAADELGVPSGTIYAWVKAFKEGRLEAKTAVHTPTNALSLNEELTYGRIRMHQALKLKQPDGINVPSERTVYRVMGEIGISHRPKRKPNGITKADKEARKSDDLIKRNFTSDKPLEKCVTDMTEVKCLDGKLYVSAVFDCFDSAVLGLAMDTNMKATLCEKTLENTYKSHPGIRGCIIHSDRGTQYTSELYRKAISKYGIIQSMNSAGGRCHDNARCESMWARLKEELLYNRYDASKMRVETVRTLIWRYFISYWNNRRICSTNGGLPPMVKRKQYYLSLEDAA